MLDIIFCMFLITGIFIVFVFVLLFKMVANRLANEFISENVTQIRSFLRDHSLGLTYGRSHIAHVAETWEWSLHHIYDAELYFLSSRQVKQLLIKLKRGEITAKEAVDYCVKYGKSNVKKTNDWDKIK